MWRRCVFGFSMFFEKIEAGKEEEVLKEVACIH